MLLSDCTRQLRRRFPARHWLPHLLSIGAALLTLICLTGLLAWTLVEVPPKNTIVTAFSRRLGVAVSIREARFDLASFLLLRPTISLRDVAVGNLLTAPRISARIALLPIAGRRIEIRGILIDTPRIAIESDARNGTNIESFLKKLSSPPPLPGASHPAAIPKAPLALDIDDVQISSGEVFIPSDPPQRLSALNLRVRNLSAGTNCRLELSAKLSGESNAGFRIEGRTGPFGSQVLPINATLKLTVDPRGLFGVIFRGPGGKAGAVLEAAIQGNLYNNVAGPARLILSGLRIGGDAAHTVPIDGEAPALFSVLKPLSAPVFHLQVLRANLKLGHGEWAGAADLQLRGQTLSGASRGSLRGVDLNALLGGGEVYGSLDVPAYIVRFAGKAADGTARLSVTNGRIATQSFHTLTCDLTVKQDRLDLSAIAFDSPEFKFTGNGTIGFDRSIHLDLGTAAAGRIVMEGTLDRPQIRRP
ncbi:MAG TPA: hypothetical protein VN893_08000 [Bryobacteraceae bacterium]|nr:hypothetical protein [Bryobacteraceae bacterium]